MAPPRPALCDVLEPPGIDPSLAALRPAGGGPLASDGFLGWGQLGRSWVCWGQTIGPRRRIGEHAAMPVGPRRALPPELATEPFTVAQGRSIGLGRKRLRGQDLDRPFRGVRVARAAVESPGEASGLAAPWTATTVDHLLIARCRALGLVLPEGAFFSHVTAARLWPLALPRMPTDQSVHVSVRAPHRGPRRTGTVGHEVTDRLTKVVVRQGLPVVDPATLFCQLACVTVTARSGCGR